MSETNETILRQSSGCIRVLLADDHPALCAGIRAILEKAPDVQVVGEVEDGTQAQQLTADLCPQVLLLDQVLPGPRPAETMAWVRAHCPETAVLVLTAHDSDYHFKTEEEIVRCTKGSSRRRRISNSVSPLIILLTDYV